VSGELRTEQLKGWKLIFNVESSRWGGRTANILRTENPNDVVYGVIYQIATQKLNVLTTYERAPPQDVTVVSQGKEVVAKTYVFSGRRSTCRPPEAYIRTITDGLRQHGYSKKIIANIERMIPKD